MAFGMWKLSSKSGRPTFENILLCVDQIFNPNYCSLCLCMYVFLLRNNCFILLRRNPLGQRKLPILISLSRMLCFGRVCASACALNVSAAVQDAYITPFPTEVVRAIRAQRDEAYVSKIVCYLHVMAKNPHPPP